MYFEAGQTYTNAQVATARWAPGGLGRRERRPSWVLLGQVVWDQEIDEAKDRQQKLHSVVEGQERVAESVEAEDCRQKLHGEVEGQERGANLLE
jgi:hypothetical protein